MWTLPRKPERGAGPHPGDPTGPREAAEPPERAGTREEEDGGPQGGGRRAPGGEGARGDGDRQWQVSERER